MGTGEICYYYRIMLAPHRRYSQLNPVPLIQVQLVAILMQINGLPILQ